LRVLGGTQGPASQFHALQNWSFPQPTVKLSIFPPTSVSLCDTTEGFAVCQLLTGPPISVPLKPVMPIVLNRPSSTFPQSLVFFWLFNGFEPSGWDPAPPLCKVSPLWVYPLAQPDLVAVIPPKNLCIGIVFFLVFCFCVLWRWVWFLFFFFFFGFPFFPVFFFFGGLCFGFFGGGCVVLASFFPLVFRLTPSSFFIADPPLRTFL